MGYFAWGMPFSASSGHTYDPTAVQPVLSEISNLEQAFPHWMESLDGIFTTDFFFNRVRDATARALFSIDDNDNVIFLGIGNTHFFNSLVSIA